MEKQTITVVIPAKNEEKNIQRCLESVNWCDRVVVISFGTDKTAEIAAKLGARVIEKEKNEKDDFKAVQTAINECIDNCQTDWMLRIDADEVVTPELKNEIENVLKFKSFKSSHVQTLEPSNIETFVAYGIPRQQFFWGDFLKGGDWAYDRLVRFFKPKYCRYEPITSIHEQFKVNGNVGYLKNSLLHYSHPTLKIAVDKFNAYTSLEINDIKDPVWKAVLKMFFLPPYIFLRWMIWHLGLRDGIRGFVAGIMRSWYEFILYAKYVEKFINNKSQITNKH